MVSCFQQQAVQRLGLHPRASPCRNVWKVTPAGVTSCFLMPPTPLLSPLVHPQQHKIKMLIAFGAMFLLSANFDEFILHVVLISILTVNLFFSPCFPDSPPSLHHPCVPRYTKAPCPKTPPTAGTSILQAVPAVCTDRGDCKSQAPSPVTNRICHPSLEKPKADAPLRLGASVASTSLMPSVALLMLWRAAIWHCVPICQSQKWFSLYLFIWLTDIDLMSVMSVGSSAE